MEKPIMSFEAVRNAARDVHLKGGIHPGGGRCDVQALASSQVNRCEYETTIGRPAHVDRLVCAIGAFFLAHDLLHVQLSGSVGNEHKRARVGRWSGNIISMIESGNLKDFVTIVPEDMDAILELQQIHDRCFCGDPRERWYRIVKFREALGLEPA